MGLCFFIDIVDEEIFLLNDLVGDQALKIGEACGAGGSQEALYQPAQAELRGDDRRPPTPVGITQPQSASPSAPWVWVWVASQKSCPSHACRLSPQRGRTLTSIQPPLHLLVLAPCRLRHVGRMAGSNLKGAGKCSVLWDVFRKGRRTGNGIDQPQRCLR